MVAAEKKNTRGRQKVAMKLMEKESNRLVTFSKRKSGLFKKASELCILCRATIVIVVSSPGGRPYSFGHPSVEAVTERFLTGNISPEYDHLSDELLRNNEDLNFLSEQLEFENKKTEALLEARKLFEEQLHRINNPEELELDELKQLEQSLSALVNNAVQYHQSLVEAHANPTSIPFVGQNSTATPSFYVPQNILGGQTLTPNAADPTPSFSPYMPPAGGENLAPNVHPSTFFSPNMLGGQNLPRNVDPTSSYVSPQMLGGQNFDPSPLDLLENQLFNPSPPNRLEGQNPNPNPNQQNLMGGQDLNPNLPNLIRGQNLNRNPPNFGEQNLNPNSVNTMGGRNLNPELLPNMMEGQNLNPYGDLANLYFPSNTLGGQNLDPNSDATTFLDQYHMLGRTPFVRGHDDQFPWEMGSNSMARGPQDGNFSSFIPNLRGTSDTGGNVQPFYEGTNNPMGGHVFGPPSMPSDSDIGMDFGDFPSFTSLLTDHLVPPNSSFVPQGSRFDPANAGSQFGPANAGSQFGLANAGSQFGPANAGSQFDPANAGSQFGPANAGSQFGLANAGSQFGPANAGSQFGPENAAGDRDNEYPNPNNSRVG